MRKYFGTDGIRGLANKDLTPELTYKLGRVAGHVLTRDSDNNKVLIGRDTRISGDLLEYALISGLLSIGAEVMRLGVISTPGVAYLTKSDKAAFGVMISASHNSFEDNGIKFFGPDGFKLTDEQEVEIERLLDKEDELPRPTGESIGTMNDYFEGGQKYLSYLKETIDHDFSGLHIAIDSANGSTSSLATHLFADLEADEISSIGASPNGVNINENVGSTYPEQLQQLVVEKQADIGLAFDGDGDRLIAVDEKGNLVDGDKIMFICGKYLNDKGFLRQNTIVSTVMSNLGFYKSLESEEITSVQVDVGDRNVMQKMREGGFNFGGEQSGHIVFLEHSTCGDGMLTALQLLNIMKDLDKPLSELADKMAVYPQVLKNVEVEDKQAVMNETSVKEAIKKSEEELQSKGRVLVRPSGTESLIRVMVEAEKEELAHKHADRLIEAVKQSLQ
ncbi:MAG TPA: phosphoglucosamine mutase [Bacillota bacterium]|nr:phosphoglucosamine mutase [Bacillota bacterium]